MGIKVSITGGKDYEPVSEGLHTVVLVDIVDLGPVQTMYGLKNKVQFVYLSDESDENGIRQIRERFTPSLHEKSTMRPRVEKLLGRALTAEEEQDFDLDTLIGIQKMAFVEHNESKDGKGKVYANIKGFAKGNPTNPVGIPDDFVRDCEKPEAEQYRNKQKGKAGAVSVKPAARVAVLGGRAVASAVLAPPQSSQITDEDIPF